MCTSKRSNSTAVVKLRKDLPHVPLDARVNLPRYILDESDAVCHCRHRYVKECICLKGRLYKR